MKKGAPGVHQSVLLREAVDAMAIHSDGIYVDATFGRGGHSRQILAQLGKQGRLIALDRDLDAVAAGNQIKDERFCLVHSSFGKIDAVLDAMNIDKVDGILLDIGVSSPQLDDASRGFSFRFDAPLDMRMDTSRGITAAEWLAEASQREIERVIKDYGEERFAHAIAKAVVTARAECSIATTRQFSTLVEKAIHTREPGQHPATRSFQALRIHINQELEELSHVLPQCVTRLAAGARLVVISFHSLEDRIVKRFLREQSHPTSFPARLPVRAIDMPRPLIRLIGKPVFPCDTEIESNPRARSAVMRIAEKCHTECYVST